MARLCSRPGCAEPAVATLGYDYGEATVWLVDVTPEAHPATYDLCMRHADGLSVPLNWELRDRRNFVGQLIEAAS